MNVLFSLMNKAQLKLALYDKQRLYAQMVKDGITGPAKDQVQNEIQEILKVLFVQVKQRTS